MQVYLQNQLGPQNQLQGMEALIRWPHFDKGFIPPDQFIPIAEESQLIVEIGDWVREECCRFLALPQMQQQSWCISINVSAREFQEDRFVDKVHQSTLRHGVAPQRLVLELTERVLLEDTHATNRKLQALRALGFEFSLDDFGTGYSSLSYLQHLPVQELKIDQSFVKSLHDPRNATLVNAILQVAKGFGLRVVAEGVETPEQIDFLRQAMPG
ncbi:MAG: EAL domain-containing protein, partial [Comamonas sp.]